MATQRIGSAAFTWSDTNHPGVNREVKLGSRLFNVRPFDPRTVHVADSLDLSTRNVISFGTQVAAITADVRFHDIGQELADLVSAGKGGATLTYYPNTEEPGESYSVYLTEGTVSPDPDTAGWGWYMASLTIRATSGTLQRIMDLDRLLFKYVAGMDLSAATFTRAASANYTDIDGVTQSAGANVARDAHHQTVSGTGTWTRTLRLEDSTSEALSFPFTHAPQAMTIYVRWVERGLLTTANGSLFHVGAGGGGTANLQCYRASTNGRLDFFHNDGSSSEESRMTTGASPGDVVEVACQLAADGQPTGYSALNGGTATVGAAAGTSATLQSAWSDDLLWIGQRNGSIGGALDVLDIKVAAGVQTMAHMRAL